MSQLEAKNVVLNYTEGEKSKLILNDINLQIKKNEIVCIWGKSGAGKSSLLNVLSGLEKPTDGRVTYNNQDLYKMKKKDLNKIRISKFGVVFQDSYLVSSLSVRDNIVFPVVASKNILNSEYMNNIISILDIGEHLKKYPHQLSGGERQRVAIARALVNKPEIVFADEPTGSLDSSNGDRVFELLLSSTKEIDSSLVFVTHDIEKRDLADRVINMKDGAIIDI